MKFPHPLVSPSYPYNPLPLYQKLQGQSSALFNGFHYWSPPQPTHLIPFKGLSSMKSTNPGLVKTLIFHFRLLSTMSHENLLKSIISVVHGSETPHATTSRYIVLNRKILGISNKMVSVQEEQDTPLVESDNHQQIFIWVRNNLNLLSVQGQTYIEW